MSASTLSITANQGPITRRRAVEKNLSTGDSDSAPNDGPTDTENRLNAGETAAAILRDARRTAAAQIPPKKSARKAAKPRWLTVVSIVTKNLALLLVLMGFVQMFRLAVWKSGGYEGDFSVISGDLDGKFAEIEKFVKTTTKAMQVQVNAVDRKLEEGIGEVRREFDEKLRKKGEEMDLKLKTLDVRSDVLEKFMDEFRSKSFLSKEEFDEFFEEFKNAKGKSGVGSGEITVDEIKHYAMEIVEKEIERHAADGLGMPDYALAVAGGRVLRHSEPGVGGGSVGWLRNRNGVVSPEAEKVIRPSFGEPGQCFPIKGSSGFVVIRLRTAIVPEAVTLEHVAKSVAYDRSSAPKHCRVSGWMQLEDSADVDVGTDKMFLLTEFTYDLEKSNAQTFKVESGAPNLINTVRFDFTSNYGNPSFTCVYRLRVHGHEPSAVPVQP